MPLVIGFVLVERAKSRGVQPIPEYAFVIFGCGLILTTHLVWYFDWGEMATESSTSGLIFLFLPIYAAIAGGLAFGITYLFSDRVASSGKGGD